MNRTLTWLLVLASALTLAWAANQATAYMLSRQEVTLADSLRHYRDSAGRMVAERGAERIGWAQALASKDSQLVALRARGQAQTTTRVVYTAGRSDTVLVRDTVWIAQNGAQLKGKAWDWTDGYLKAKGLLEGQQMAITYGYTDTLDIDIEQRAGHVVARAQLRNPTARVTAMRTLQLEGRSPSRWHGWYVGAGVGYCPAGPMPWVGVGYGVAIRKKN